MLQSKANKLRQKILTSVYEAGKGHIGGSLSCIDFLTTLFYTKNNWDFTKKNPDRDRFILSKGHSALALYSILEDCGVITTDDLESMNTGGLLGEHPDTNMPGIEIIAGSLGHGLGIATGIALSLKKRNSPAKVFVLLSDGECCEGSTWEAAMFAADCKLDNLIAIVDNNGFAINKDMKYMNIVNKFSTFGWTSKPIDGHDFNGLVNLLQEIDNPIVLGPHAIILNTIKGKGISFMENKKEWHHGSISDKQYKQILKELS